MNEKNKLVIYQGANGEIQFEADLKQETIWARQEQIADLFNIERSVATKHINKILRDEEVEEKSNVQKMHIANSDKAVKFYSLDIVLAVGYRANSKVAIQFRKWATKTLKNYLIKGVVVNEKRLKELNQILQIVARSDVVEISGIADILANYTGALTILQEYDDAELPEIDGTKPAQNLTYEAAREFLNQTDFAKNSANFARERNDSFKGIIANLYQTFAGAELYRSTEEKAANLLYQIVKDHPFVDGNKRSAAALFVYFLDQNKLLKIARLDAKGKKSGARWTIEPNALAAMTLMIALSQPAEKENMIKLVMNLIEMGARNG